VIINPLWDKEREIVSSGIVVVDGLVVPVASPQRPYPHGLPKGSYSQFMYIQVEFEFN